MSIKFHLDRLKRNEDIAFPPFFLFPIESLVIPCSIILATVCPCYCNLEIYFAIAFNNVNVTQSLFQRLPFTKTVNAKIGGIA